MLVSRSRHAWVATAIAVTVLAGAASATPKTYDFEGLAAGTIISGQETNGQFLPKDPYPDFDIMAVGVQATNSLCVFNSAFPTGSDVDLGTPNEDFGGPGIGLGGRAGMPGENRLPQGKVLIIPENLVDVNRDGLVDMPDDNAHGGYITIDWDQPGVLYSLTLIDIEEIGATVDLFRGDQLVQSFPVPSLGDNSQVKISTQTTSRIDRTVIFLPGSGALAQLTFDSGAEPPCIISGPSEVCSGSLATFTAAVSGAYNFQWSVQSTPPGICSIVGGTTGSSLNVAYAAGGTCTVTLTVADATSPAFSTTCTRQVNVIADLAGTIDGPAEVCAGSIADIFNVNVPGATSLAWSITGNGSIIGPNTGTSVNVMAGAAGDFTLQVIAAAASCADTISKAVRVKPLPTCAIAGAAAVCAGSTGNAYTITSDVAGAAFSTTITGNGTIIGPVTGASVNVTAGAAGSFTLTTIAAAAGCTTTCSKTVTVNAAATCAVDGPAAVCAGSTGNAYTLSSGLVGATYSTVISGNGSIIGSATGTTVTVTAGAAGTFTLTTTVSANGCSGTCTKTVTVNAVPTCSITGPASLCAGASGTYNLSSDIPGATFSTVVGGNPVPVSGAVVNVTAGAAGSITLTTTVTATGCSGTCTKTITVNPVPTCSIDGPAAVCAGSAGNVYTINGNVPGATFTTVIAGNGSIIGPVDGGTVTVTAGGAGSFTLTTTVSAAGCSSTCTKTVTVNPVPTCSIDGPEAVCAGSTGNVFTITSPVAGTTFATAITGNGTITGPTTGATVTVTAGASGAFTLTTTATAAGCTSTCTKRVVVNASGTCSIDGPATVCAGSTGNTFDISTNLIGATFSTVISGNGSIVGSASGSTVTVTAGAAGSFTLTTTVAASGCSTTCTKTVTVNSVPTCSISGDAAVCAGSSGNAFTLTSSVGGATFSTAISGNGTIVGSTTGSTVTVTAGAAGSFTLTTTVTAAGCSSTCTKTVTVNAGATCSIDGAGAVCAGSTGNAYTITSNLAGATFSTQISGNGSITGFSNGSTVTVTAGAAGSFTLTTTVTAAGCSSTCTKTVTVNAIPTCSISGAAGVCSGSAANLYTITSGLAGATFSTQISGNGSIVGSSTGASVSVTAGASGSFTLTTTVTAGGCSSTCTKTVTVNPALTCTISGPGDSICVGTTGMSYSVASQAGATYAWSISGDATISGPVTGASVTVNTTTSAGSFTLSVTVSNGTCSSTCSITRITVNCTGCYLTGSGCITIGQGATAQKHSFSGNVGPTPSGSWSHSMKVGNKTMFNFASHNAHVVACWQDMGPGPCSPSAPSDNVIFEGAGQYSLESGTKLYDGTFEAHAEDHGEGGGCGDKSDEYSITIYDLSGAVVLHVEGISTCGNLQIHRGSSTTTATTIAPLDGPQLGTPSPNPFRTATRIAYAVNGLEAQPVDIGVFDISGRLVRSLRNAVLSPGSYETTWDGRNDSGETVVAGMYFVRVVAGPTQAVTRVMFAR